VMRRMLKRVPHMDRADNRTENFPRPVHSHPIKTTRANSAPKSREALQQVVSLLSRSRPLIRPQSKYRVGDRVWFDPGGSRPREGPYLIASVPSTARYTLCHDEDGNFEAVNNKEEVGESQLKRA
jgi:hypothetical protein